MSQLPIEHEEGEEEEEEDDDDGEEEIRSLRSSRAVDLMHIPRVCPKLLPLMLSFFDNLTS